MHYYRLTIYGLQPDLPPEIVDLDSWAEVSDMVSRLVTDPNSPYYGGVYGWSVNYRTTE